MANVEVEDLIPTEVLVNQFDRWQRSDSPLADTIDPSKPIVPQIEAWAKQNGVSLKVPGWKVELAKKVKEQLLKDGPSKLDPAVLDRWAALFLALQQNTSSPQANQQ